jgi:hypothetical protein
LGDCHLPSENFGGVIFGFELLVKKHKVFFPFLQLDFDNGEEKCAKVESRSLSKSDAMTSPISELRIMRASQILGEIASHYYGSGDLLHYLRSPTLG